MRLRFHAKAALAALICLPAQANDGRNRYEQGMSAELVHWHGPISAQGGYRVLIEDMAGGADGDPAFRWVNRHALALTRLASHRTVQTLGPAPLPYPVFDLASENADTPLTIGPEGARGRHPGGSHAGGLNLDLGYYLSSEQGKLKAPERLPLDPAAPQLRLPQGPEQAAIESVEVEVSLSRRIRWRLPVLF